MAVFSRTAMWAPGIPAIAACPHTTHSLEGGQTVCVCIFTDIDQLKLSSHAPLVRAINPFLNSNIVQQECQGLAYILLFFRKSTEVENTFMQIPVYIAHSQTCVQTLTVSDERTQFSTEEADPVVATEAVSLVLVEADEAVVFVILVDHVSCLVGRYAIVGFSLDEGKMNDKNQWRVLFAKTLLKTPKRYCHIL